MMRGNMGALLKQAQRVQANIKKMEADLAAMEITGAAANDLVTVTMTGKHVVKSVKIKPEAVSEDDIDMLEDLVLAAVKDACEKVEATTKAMTAKATAGMPIPPGFM
ncbi:MAG TPA: YbaB/EbfC family nucleoid-associated protein [Sutterella sp.]|nr:YbaB/EbfC family nucleoid-associated protein [Sutterella sp.]